MHVRLEIGVWSGAGYNVPVNYFGVCTHRCGGRELEVDHALVVGLAPRERDEISLLI